MKKKKDKQINRFVKANTLSTIFFCFLNDFFSCSDCHMRFQPWHNNEFFIFTNFDLYIFVTEWCSMTITKEKQFSVTRIIYRKRHKKQNLKLTLFTCAIFFFTRRHWKRNGFCFCSAREKKDRTIDKIERLWINRLLILIMKIICFVFWNAY